MGWKLHVVSYNWEVCTGRNYTYSYTATVKQLCCYSYAETHVPLYRIPLCWVIPL